MNGGPGAGRRVKTALVQLSSTAGASLEAVRAVDPGWKVQPYASYYTDKANKEKQRHHSSQASAQKGQAAELSSSSRQQQQQGVDSDSDAGDSAGPPSSSSRPSSQGSPLRAKGDRDAPNRASNVKAILPTGKSSSLPQKPKEAGEPVNKATLPQGGGIARVPAPSDEAFRVLGDRLRELPASLGSPQRSASDPDSSSSVLKRPGHKSE